jgi:hypothetical protein
MRRLAEETKRQALELLDSGKTKKMVCELAGLSYPSLQILIQTRKAQFQAAEKPENGILPALMAIDACLKSSSEQQQLFIIQQLIKSCKNPDSIIKGISEHR